MKAVLEPNEILIRIMPTSETPTECYYTLQTKNVFRLYDNPPELIEEIQRRLEEKSAPRIVETTI